MQYTFAVLGLMASLAVADDLPVPRNMCGVTDSSGNVFQPVTYGPIICSIAWAAGQASAPTIPFTDKDCTPAFCHDNTAVDICKAPGKTPGAVAWSELSAQVEKAFTACGGVARDGNDIINPNGGANDVRFQPFQYVADGYTITARGQNCDEGDYKAATFDHC